MDSPPHRQPSRWVLLAVVLLGAVTTAAAPGQAVPPPADLSALNPNTALVVENPAVADAISRIANALTMPRYSPIAPPPRNPCAGNATDRLIKVSITEQHAWMCEKSTLVHDSPATTGAADFEWGTPLGTWQIISKESDRFLEGADYYEHVDYWLQYDGEFGIHDSAWQVIPYGSPDYRNQGSHGCVHLPADAMDWTFNWSQLGTTVIIAP